MVDVKQFVGRIEVDHLEALHWFNDHAGKTVPWSELKSHAAEGARLFTAAKGIYKPAYTDYALSVRQNPKSPYYDLDIEHRPDGSWLYPYFQENTDPQKRDDEATNRGLMKCMSDEIPVGVMIQSMSKPGPEYHILGLARVVDWKEGYFFLEGYNTAGEISSSSGEKDAVRDRVSAVITQQVEEAFNPSQHSDQREKAISLVNRRRGQANFRKSLLECYKGKCAITECDAVEALEAAHITPYLGPNTNSPQNGLLLRSDIHSLFDLGLLSINPDTSRVVLSDSLKISSYSRLEGVELRRTTSPKTTPSSAALSEHYKWAGLRRLT